jgi:hypothetical protein
MLFVDEFYSAFHTLTPSDKVTDCTTSESEFDSWHFKEISFPSKGPAHLWSSPSGYGDGLRYIAPGLSSWTLIFIYFCVWNKWNCTSTTHMSSWLGAVFYTQVYGAPSVWVDGLQLSMCEENNCFNYFIFMFPCIMTQYTKMTNKRQLCRIIYYSLAAVHVLSDIFAHHQEHLNCITASGITHVYRCRLVSWECWNAVPTLPWYQLMMMSENIARNM